MLATSAHIKGAYCSYVFPKIFLWRETKIFAKGGMADLAKGVNTPLTQEDIPSSRLSPDRSGNTHNGVCDLLCHAMYQYTYIFSCCVQLRVLPIISTCNWLKSIFGDTPRPWVQPTPPELEFWIKASFGDSNNECLYISIMSQCFPRLSLVWVGICSHLTGFTPISLSPLGGEELGETLCGNLNNASDIIMLSLIWELFLRMSCSSIWEHACTGVTNDRNFSGDYGDDDDNNDDDDSEDYDED